MDNIKDVIKGNQFVIFYFISIKMSLTDRSNFGAKIKTEILLTFKNTFFEICIVFFAKQRRDFLSGFRSEIIRTICTAFGGLLKEHKVLRSCVGQFYYYKRSSEATNCLRTGPNPIVPSGQLPVKDTVFNVLDL